MREIKFRAWDKTNKVMVRESNMLVDFEGKLWLRNFGSVLITELLDEPYIIMQCTGLKDMNGKEIYEGDILQKGKNVNGFVEYENGGYHCVIYTKQNAKKQCFHLSLMTREYEIIGNIYENPELMKK